MSKLTGSLRDPHTHTPKKNKNKRHWGIMRTGRFQIVTSEFPEFQESGNGCSDRSYLNLGNTVTAEGTVVGPIWVSKTKTKYLREASKRVVRFWKMKQRVKSGLFGAGRGVCRSE